VKNIGCIALGGLLLMFAVTSLFINILPGLMVEDFARRAPGAKPLIEQWVVSGVGEEHLYGQEDLAQINTHTPGRYPFYTTGTVYAGGVVEFLDYFNPDPTMVCEMASVRLTDCFGTARGTSWNDHSGIDYGIAADTPVIAPMGGVVSYAGPKGAYGNLVVIESNGYQTYFAHNNALLVEVGQFVTAGEAIALAGSTGNSTGPHIHFEVRKCDPETGFCLPVNPGTVLLPGATAPCDFYFGAFTYVFWGGAEQIEFTCGVDEQGSFFIDYVCESPLQRGMPWCQ
jgi:hypothetical protein